MMEIQDIKLALARRYIRPGNGLYCIDELDKIELNPQKHREHRALKAEASVIIANLENLCIVVHLAMGDDNLIYTGYSLEHPTGGSLSGPSRNRKVKPGVTIRKALRNELENIRYYQRFYGDRPDKRIVRSVNEALRRINACSLHQSTIFEML